MTMTIDAVADWLGGFQERLLSGLQALEPQATFLRDGWERPTSHGGALGGRGLSCVLEGGSVFERAGVNFSDVRAAHLPPSASAAHPEFAGRAFRASGVSMVVHPRNPKVPTAHLNVRVMMTADGEGWWFGGGYDLTPYYLDDADVKHWHDTAREAVAPFGDDVYPEFKRRADGYFVLHHRGERRGMGGLFFDDLNASPGVGSGDFAHCFSLIRAVGDSLLPAYVPIVTRHADEPYTEAQRAWQLHRRGRYVEFNLVHDRGTLFGLQSKGRIESILMSMPPLASWAYGPKPVPGSPEARLLEAVAVAAPTTT